MNNKRRVYRTGSFTMIKYLTIALTVLVIQGLISLTAYAEENLTAVEIYEKAVPETAWTEARQFPE